MVNISERIKTQNGHLNLNWLKHQYFILGRSIQDIADELNVTMMSIRKILDRLENKPVTRELNGQLKDKPTSKPVKDFSKVETRDWQPTLILGSEKEKPKISSSNRWKQKIEHSSEFSKKEITEKPNHMESPSTIEKLEIVGSISGINEEKSKGPSSQLHTISKSHHKRANEKPPSTDSFLQTIEEKSVLSNLHKKKKKQKITYHTCKFCGLKLPKKARFCIQCGTIIKNKSYIKI